MNFIKKCRIGLIAAALAGSAAMTSPSQGANGIHIFPGRTASIQWPSNTINLSQLQQLENQYAGSSQLNIQFPNQLNWSVTPDSLQSMLSGAQQTAQAMGVVGPLPNFVFSSLSSVASSNGVGQMSIQQLMNGDVKGQLSDVMRQLRYEQLNLSNALPDWLKEIIVTVYNAVYEAFNYVQAQIAAFLRPILG